jgi:hypothetical protein
MLSREKEEVMQTKAMRRAARSARAVLHGPEILELVQEPKTRRALVAAAESGVPPVTAISGKLVKFIPTKDAKLLPLKQFTGLCVRAVLEEEGFEVADTGVRVSNDQIFRTGSTYRRIQVEQRATSEVLLRIIQTLEEATQALRRLHKRLQ